MRNCDDSMGLGLFKLTLEFARQWMRRAPVARSPQYVALHQGTVWSARLNAGESVCCKSGVLWLTQTGDATDYLLRAGEGFTATSPRCIVVQALEESRFRVEQTK